VLVNFKDFKDSRYSKNSRHMPMLTEHQKEIMAQFKVKRELTINLKRKEATAKDQPPEN